MRGGYSELRLDARRIRVEFQGNDHTPREVVHRYLLYRCAELTLAAGDQDFVIVEFMGRPEIYMLQEIERVGHAWEVPAPTPRYVARYGAVAVIATSRDAALPRGLARHEPEEALAILAGERPGLGRAVFDARRVLTLFRPAGTP
jgi:hypothetical protein